MALNKKTLIFLSPTPAVLHIYAPSDSALSSLFSSSPGAHEENLGASPRPRAALLAKHMVLAALTYEDCDEEEEKEAIETLQPDYMIRCSG